MVLEYRPQWNAGGPNPGFSVLHGRGQTGAPAGLSSQDLADRVRTLFDAIKAFVPNDVTFSFPGEVLDRNTSTGTLEAVHAVTPPASVVGTSAGSFNWPSGFRFEWRTPAIVNGKRLRGRLFIVPAGGTTFDSDGTITAAALTSLQTAAAAYISTSVFTNVAPSVWSSTHGIQADITSVLIPDEASVMRSRRD